MGCVKRSRDGVRAQPTPDVSTPYMSMFEHFRTELDEQHDRRDRIIKASRDITSASKKIIFALQRAPRIGDPMPKSISKGIVPMMSSIRETLGSIKADLQGINAQRYQRQISPGLQEYVEAKLFQHYLETGEILGLQSAAQTIPADIQLTHDDYVLGLFDTTGEMMRFAVTNLAMNASNLGAEGGEFNRTNILTDMQQLRSCLETIDASPSFGLARDFEQKLKVTRASVEKVEYAMYSMLVRGKERPKGWKPDASLAEGTKEEYDIETFP